MYDALYSPSGKSVDALLKVPEYFECVIDAYMHCKTIAFGEGTEKLLSKSDIQVDKGIVQENDKDWTKEMIALMKKHRYWQRELDLEKEK